MPTRARLSQERSRHRREELLDAAIALFADGGARGITHRAVASKAGLPPATTTYYFTSINELIEEALSRHIGIWLHDLEALTADPVEVDISIADAESLISAIFAAHSPETVGLQLSIYLAAARNRELRPKAAEALDALEVLIAKMLHHVGILEAATVARSVVSVIVGTSFSRLSARHTNEEEAAVLYHSIRGLVVAAMLSEDQISAKLRELRSGPTTPH